MSRADSVSPSLSTLLEQSESALLAVHERAKHRLRSTQLLLETLRENQRRRNSNGRAAFRRRQDTIVSLENSKEAGNLPRRNSGSDYHDFMASISTESQLEQNCADEESGIPNAVGKRLSDEFINNSNREQQKLVREDEERPTLT